MAYQDFVPDPEKPVLVIGAAGVDLVGRPTAEISPGTSIAARIRTSYGGAARNVAENLARLGQPVSLLTAVGDDHTGEHLLEDLRSAGVDVSHTLVSPAFSTGTYLAVISPRGELTFALDDMFAATAITPEVLHSHTAAFDQASMLFVDMNLSAAALRTAVSLAVKRRLPIFADPTSVSLAKKLIPYLSRVHFMTPNHAEAAVLCGSDTVSQNRDEALEIAGCLVGRGVKIVVITLAEFGLVYATPDARGYIPAIKTEIVDPTGAGDALTATVIFALLNDMPLDDAMRLGLSAASLTLRYTGAVRPDLSLENLYHNLVI